MRFGLYSRWPVWLLGAVFTVVVTFSVLLTVNEGPIWWLVMTRKIPLDCTGFDGHEVRGWTTVKRWQDDGLLSRVMDALSDEEDPPEAFIAGDGKWSPKHGMEVAYYVETRYNGYEKEFMNTECVRYTWWLVDGRVRYQRRVFEGAVFA